MIEKKVKIALLLIFILKRLKTTKTVNAKITPNIAVLQLLKTKEGIKQTRVIMFNLFFFRKLIKIILSVKMFKNPLNLSLTSTSLIFSIMSEKSTTCQQLMQE